MALNAGIAKKTAQRISNRVKAEHGIVFCPCGKVAGHKGFCHHRIANSPGRIAYLLGCWRDITKVNFYIPSRPRYERPDIPYERETEINYLVNQRFIASLDAPMFSGDDSYHSFVPSSGDDPLALLIAKEEAAERFQRQKEIDRYQRFQLLNQKRQQFPSLIE